MRFDSIKKAPTGGTVKGETLSTNLSYQDEDGLSTAAGILLLICQASEPAERLHHQWERFDQVLREHYTKSSCGAMQVIIPDVEVDG